VKDPASAQVGRVNVMKFGATPVADTDKIRNVARRMVATHETGRPTVGVVSAMGETTDTLAALAAEVSPRPHPREMDMLLSTGERITAALCAMAIEDMGHRAVSLTGSQAGIVTDTRHTNAKIVDIRPKRITKASGGSSARLAGGDVGSSSSMRQR